MRRTLAIAMLSLSAALLLAAWPPVAAQSVSVSDEWLVLAESQAGDRQYRARPSGFVERNRGTASHDMRVLIQNLSLPDRNITYTYLTVTAQVCRAGEGLVLFSPTSGAAPFTHFYVQDGGDLGSNIATFACLVMLGDPPATKKDSGRKL